MHSCKQMRARVFAGFVLRQKQHSDGKRPLRRQINSGLFEEKCARNRGQNADAVAALAIGSYRAAMRQPPQRSQCKTQNVVIGRAVQGRNKSDSARLMIETGVYEGWIPGTVKLDPMFQYRAARR